MKSPLLSCAALLSILTASAADAADKSKPQTIRLRVDLTDGSRLIGTAEKFDAFPFHVTKRETVSLNTVWRIEANGDDETWTIQLRDGSSRSGVIDLETFSMRTKLGVLRVPVPLLKRLVCSLDGVADPKTTNCNPAGSTVVGRIAAGKTVWVRMNGQWTFGGGQFLGPTGSKSMKYDGNNYWCAMLILQDQTGKPVRKIAYPGRAVSIKGDEKKSLSIVVRMNDDFFADNRHKPGDPMRCTVFVN